MKILSIIIPIYNMEKYLPECLASLNRQGFGDDVEVLLVDDGSKDSSLQICKDAANSYSYYQIIHQENQGVASARNTGLFNSKGKYIAWVDPDDYITDDWWNTIKEEVIKNPEMIYFDMYSLNGEILKEINYGQVSKVIDYKELCEEFALNNILSHLWSKIFLRTLFEEKFSNRYSFCEDYALIHYLVWKVNTCRYIHKPLYVYRQRETSITHDRSKLLDNYRLGICLSKKRYKFFRKKNIQVSYDGVYLAMINYCYEYKRHYGENVYIHQKRFFKMCIGVLRKKFGQIIKSNNLLIKQKIKVIIAVVGLIWFVVFIKKLYITLRKYTEER